MKFNFPRNNDKYYWTEHAKYKMQYYGLGAQKVLGVIRRPKRKEEGMVKNTIAVMQPTQSKKPSEVWVMYQNHKTYNMKHKTEEKLIPNTRYKIPDTRY